MKGTPPPFRGLLANAGVQRWSDYAHTRDGFEVTFGTNVLGHYLLVRLLAPLLARPGRIILVTSSTHFGDFRNTWGMVATPRWTTAELLARPAAHESGREAAGSAYSTSKLALVYLAHELARRLPEDVEAYSYNPGPIPGTGLTRQAPAFVRFVSRTVFQGVRVLPGAVRATTSGSEPAAALCGPAPGPSGAYLDRGRPIDSSAGSYHPEREAELWETAARLVGLGDE